MTVIISTELLVCLTNTLSVSQRSERSLAPYPSCNRDEKGRIVRDISHLHVVAGSGMRGFNSATLLRLHNAVLVNGIVLNNKITIVSC
jgi:hypothetical protein